jgi:plasmid stabilization system protein ParE
MKLKHLKVLILIFAFTLQNCSSTKVLNAWKAEDDIVSKFKSKNVLVIARTANDHARIAFERAIADELRSKGIKTTESYTKAPKIHPNREMSEERLALIKSMMASEGFTAVVLTVIKEKDQTSRTSYSGISVGATYGNYYPGYYGGFYDYFSYPYAYGSYYDSFGGYIPMSSSTYTTTNYVLETVVYNLEEEGNNQLVAVVTTSLKDPKEAYKTAEAYVREIIQSLEQK